MENVRRIRNGIKAVILDFDGTIADSMPFLTKLAVEVITRKYEISKEEAKQTYIETTGLNFASQIESIFPNHPNNLEAVNIFETEKLKDIFNCPIFPDVIHTLNFFRRKGVKTFICSSTRQEIVKKYCKLKGLDTLIDGILGYKPGFEKYKQLNFIFQKFDLQPGSALFIGDSLKDCDFAEDEGVNFIGICRIFKSEDFQKREVLSIDTLSDVMKFF